LTRHICRPSSTGSMLVLMEPYVEMPLGIEFQMGMEIPLESLGMGEQVNRSWDFESEWGQPGWNGSEPYVFMGIRSR